jgi:outer membrane protein assembly factor BamD (BamD/ComL family)
MALPTPREFIVPFGENRWAAASRRIQDAIETICYSRKQYESMKFESLHESMGLKTKAQTFEAILYFVSTKDKIDPVQNSDSFRLQQPHAVAHGLRFYESFQYRLGLKEA